MTVPINYLIQKLQGEDAPRILFNSSLAQDVLLHPLALSPLATSRLMKRLVTMGIVEVASRGIYINKLAQPSVKLAEVAQYLSRGAVVSLQTVLSDAGMLNNYTPWVTAISPLFPGHIKPITGTIRRPGGVFRFHSMPTYILSAGKESDTREPVPYLRATPEKAFLDWIYLGYATRSTMTPPPLDLEYENLNQTKIKRIAKAMDIENKLDDWKKKKHAYDEHPETKANSPL